MTTLADADHSVAYANPAEALSEICDLARQGALAPYLGPGILPTDCAIPRTPEGLAEFLGGKVALPRRARGNAWAAAQYIESMKHRSTLTSLMRTAFAADAAPGELHRALARGNFPLIVDVWYDSAMRQALHDRSDWGEVQGATRADVGADQWFRFYDAHAKATDAEAAAGWRTLVYKPHGSIEPCGNFLISDSDYVEVLTEIDIQSPIPDEVKARRSGKSFLFLGCRFDDQMLRTYARQIMKRSGARHYMIVGSGAFTKNEVRFIEAQNIVPVDLSLAELTAALPV